MNEIQALQEIVEEARQRLAEVNRQKEHLEVEIRAYERALALIQRGFSPHMQPQLLLNTLRERKQRRITSSPWLNVLESMYAMYPHGLNYQQINDIVHSVEGERSEETRLRSQMSLYAKQGIVKRMENGIFSITEDGAERIGKSLRGELS